MANDNQPSGQQDDPRGIFYAAAAYFVWGLVPLYWRLLDDVSPLETTLHRTLWCALFGLAVTAARGRLSRLISIVRTRSLMLPLAASGLLITVNWTIFMYCVVSHQLVEAALGYYLTPLVSIALGVTALGERISWFRGFAIALATAGVGVETVALGHIPWVAPALALSFGFYGYVRKLTPVDALEGLTVETLLFLPIAAVLIGFWALNGTGAFPAPTFTRDALLIFTGPLTALPLTLFAAGARRVRMTTLGFLQYLSPTITLLVATLVLHEPFTAVKVAAFGCIWTALVSVSLEGRFPSFSRRPASP